MFGKIFRFLFSVWIIYKVARFGIQCYGAATVSQNELVSIAQVANEVMRNALGHR